MLTRMNGKTDPAEADPAEADTAEAKTAKAKTAKGGPGKGQEEAAESRRDFVNLLAVIVCLVILILGFWLMNRLWEAKKLQDCVFSGRRNCGTSIDVTHAQ